jgi:hypothetical protein
LSFSEGTTQGESDPTDDAPIIVAGAMFCDDGTVLARLRVGDHVA